jgi:hypothetical protein
LTFLYTYGIIRAFHSNMKHMSSHFGDELRTYQLQPPERRVPCPSFVSFSVRSSWLSHSAPSRST